MTRFENDEITFEVPDGWVDASRTMFVFPEMQANVCLTRRVADPSIPLAEYVNALVRLMATQWPGLEVVERRRVRVGDEVGAHVEVEWKGRDGHQRSITRIVFCERELWSLTGTTPVEKLEETRRTIDRTMLSLSPR